jgi:hypothetical protein
MVTNENFCARLLITHVIKKKRADLCYQHKIDPRSSTFQRKDKDHDKAW